jgi:hypothetical protein
MMSVDLFELYIELLKYNGKVVYCKHLSWNSGEYYEICVESYRNYLPAKRRFRLYSK